MSLSCDDRLPATQHAALHEQKRFQALVENISDVICLLNRSWRVVYVSPSIHRILGYHPKERLGQHAFNLLYPEDEAAAEKLTVI